MKRNKVLPLQIHQQQHLQTPLGYQERGYLHLCGPPWLSHTSITKPLPWSQRFMIYRSSNPHLFVVLMPQPRAQPRHQLLGPRGRPVATQPLSSKGYYLQAHVWSRGLLPGSAGHVQEAPGFLLRAFPRMAFHIRPPGAIRSLMRCHVKKGSLMK